MSSRTPGSLVSGRGRLPEPGDVVGGKYQVEGLLGVGGMGAVYRAQHRLTRRRVALKYLLANDEGMRMRFVREARAMGALEHPKVVQILDIGEDGGAVYMVMEFMEGVSLKEHLQKKAVAPAEAVRLLMPALEGIAAAHQAGIVHRDLKPANLFVCLDRDGTPFDTKVLDFGVAFSLRLAGQDSELTQSGAVVGTPRYMAPEQIRGDRGVDDRSDQFAVGLILFEMLTGRLPYEAGGYEALVVEIATVDPVSPRLFSPGLPEELADVVLKALAKNPEDRFIDIGGLARALESFGEGVVYHPPRRAHARHSILGEDIVELAAASASLTPNPSTSGGMRSTLDDPDRGSDPPTRNLGGKSADPAWFEAPTDLPMPRSVDPEAPTRAGLPAVALSEDTAAIQAPSPRRRMVWPLLFLAALVGITLFFALRAPLPEVAAPKPAATPAAVLPEGEPPPSPAPEPPEAAAVAEAPPPAPETAAPPAVETSAAEPAREPRPRRRSSRRRSANEPASMTTMTRAVGRSGSIAVEDF